MTWKEDNPPSFAAEDPRFVPAVDMLHRTGLTEFQIRFHDDPEPVVWVAAGRWGERWECCGAMSPLVAVFRLCDQVMDGGHCMHCDRPTGFNEGIHAMPMDELICWYSWDPELKTFRRACEGQTSS